jgi:pantoate--beta-alanine ligase
METLTNPHAMQAWADAEHRAGRRIALVPTMGALHEGHLALVAAARRRAERVVVSIFVNPMQFNRRDDFDRYPRTLDADAAACGAAAVDAVYAPSPAASIRKASVARRGGQADRALCAARPGHFRGVTTA